MQQNIASCEHLVVCTGIIARFFFPHLVCSKNAVREMNWVCTQGVGSKRAVRESESLFYTSKFGEKVFKKLMKCLILLDVVIIVGWCN